MHATKQELFEAYHAHAAGIAAGLAEHHQITHPNTFMEIVITARLCPSQTVEDFLIENPTEFVIVGVWVSSQAKREAVSSTSMQMPYHLNITAAKTWHVYRACRLPWSLSPGGRQVAP